MADGIVRAIKHAAITRPGRPSADEVPGAESTRTFWLVAFALVVGLLGPALVPEIVSRSGAVASGVLSARRVGP
jgi:hypothetical protein